MRAYEIMDLVAQDKGARNYKVNEKRGTRHTCIAQWGDWNLWVTDSGTYTFLYTPTANLRDEKVIFHSIRDEGTAYELAAQKMKRPERAEAADLRPEDIITAPPDIAERAKYVTPGGYMGPKEIKIKPKRKIGDVWPSNQWRVIGSTGQHVIWKDPTSHKYNIANQPMPGASKEEPYRQYGTSGSILGQEALVEAIRSQYEEDRASKIHEAILQLGGPKALQDYLKLSKQDRLDFIERLEDEGFIPTESLSYQMEMDLHPPEGGWGKPSRRSGKTIGEVEEEFMREHGPMVERLVEEGYVPGEEPEEPTEQ